MYIISILVNKRTKEVPEVQEILTKYGEEILSRLGMHNLTQEKNGLILVIYNGNKIDEFIEELNQIGNVDVNYMEA